MVSRALVNQGGTVVNESNAAAALHIREDELDDRMTEDCNMSDGRSTFIEWVQYLMGYAAEVTPAAGAVLLDRGQFPDGRPYTRSFVQENPEHAGCNDDALNDCFEDPDFQPRGAVLLQSHHILHGDAERRDHALARHLVRRVGVGPWSRTSGPTWRRALTRSLRP